MPLIGSVNRVKSPPKSAVQRVRAAEHRRRDRQGDFQVDRLVKTDRAINGDLGNIAQRKRQAVLINLAVVDRQHDRMVQLQDLGSTLRPIGPKPANKLFDHRAGGEFDVVEHDLALDERLPPGRRADRKLRPRKLHVEHAVRPRRVCHEGDEERQDAVGDLVIDLCIINRGFRPSRAVKPSPLGSRSMVGSRWTTPPLRVVSIGSIERFPCSERAAMFDRADLQAVHIGMRDRRVDFGVQFLGDFVEGNPGERADEMKRDRAAFEVRPGLDPAARGWR